MTAETENWEIIGTVQPNDGGPKRRIGLSPQGEKFVVLIERYGKWEIKAGPWTFETMRRCAENIVAGDKRAITWPDAQLCLSAGYVAILCEVERRHPPQEPTSCGEGDRASSAFAREAQPPAATMPPAPPAGCTECGA